MSFLSSVCKMSGHKTVAHAPTSTCSCLKTRRPHCHRSVSITMKNISCMDIEHCRTSMRIGGRCFLAKSVPNDDQQVWCQLSQGLWLPLVSTMPVDVRKLLTPNVSCVRKNPTSYSTQHYIFPLHVYAGHFRKG